MCRGILATKIALVLSVCLFSVGSCTAGASPSIPTALSASVTTMVAQFSKSCVDVAGGSSRLGLGIDESTCTGASNQSFAFNETADGYYTIQPQNDSLCADAGPGPITTGIQIVQNICSGGATQKWKVVANGDGTYYVTTPDGSGCIDVFAGRKTNGTSVTTYACHSGDNQRFLLSGFIASSGTGSAPGPSGAGSVTTMVAQFSKSCVDVAGGSTSVGLGIDEWTCAGTSNQRFKFSVTSDGYYTIKPQNGSLCLDAGSGSITTGLPVVQNTCLGNAGQKWKVLANADASYSIATANGAGCLDVFAGRTANGTSVTTYACHSADNERFLMAGFTASSAPPPTLPPPVLPPPPTNTPPPTVGIPAPAADPSAPRIFNASKSARPGDIASVQGTNFDSSSQVWLAGLSGTSASQLSVINRVGTTQLSVQLPQTWDGAMTLWVSNSHGASNAAQLNGAIPWNLDALQIVPNGVFKIFGLNLLMGGYTPTVTVDGQIAAVNLNQSDENMLVISAPANLQAISACTILVDSGNGSGPARLDRQIAVVPGSGDPFSLGVGWAAGFTFSGRTLQVLTPCNGSQDDSISIQNAINAVSVSGGVVQLPPGTCRLVHSLTMRSNVVLQGAGKALTILRYEANYPIFSQGLDLAGLRDFTLVNAGSVQEGPIWKQNTRSFFQRLKIDMGVSRQLFFTDNQNFVVTASEFLQRGSIGGQNPYLFSGSSGFVFSGNTTTWIDGSPTFQSVHDAVFSGNTFHRDATNQYESVIVATHCFVMDFAYRIAILDNTFDVINGPVTNKNRNDGETLLTEGGGGNRTENIGTATSASSTTIDDANNTLNVNPFGTGLPKNYGVAIVDGKGAGQTREVTAYASGSMQVDHAWDVIPDSTSHYATFVWGLEKSLIKGNTLVGNPRGIWLYQCAIRDVELIANTFTNGGGIFIRSFQSETAKQFDPNYGVAVQDNVVSNSTGLWMSYINAVFVNKDRAPFGTAQLGIEIRNNAINANNPNVTSNTEDYAAREGFLTLMRSEVSGGQLTSTPMLLGTILQANQCVNCMPAYVTGTGDYGTVLYRNQPAPSAPNFLSDWIILSPAIATGSIGTVIQ